MHLGILLLLAGPALGTNPTAAIKPLSKLVWGTCENEDYRHAGLDCAKLIVPVDWDNAGGSNITLALTRIPARPDCRKGSLLFNPGGPGLPSSYWLSLLATNKTYLSQNLRDHFDIVGIDSRGVGESTRVKCDHELWNNRPSQLVRNEGDFQRLVVFQKTFAASCEARSGDLVKHVSTLDVVKDYEATRVALAEEKVSFLLQSYGTQIGAAFASRFPSSVDRMVFDGSVDTSLSEIPALTSEVFGLDSVWRAFGDWCAASPQCKTHGLDVNAQITKLLDQATAEPILSKECQASGDCRALVRPEDLVGAIQSFLDYKELPDNLAEENDTWQSFSAHLLEAFHGNVTAFSPGIAKDDDGTTLVGFDGPWMQTPVINCLDWRFGGSSAVKLLNQYRFISSAAALQGFAQQYAINTLCFDWPFQRNLDPIPAPDFTKLVNPVLLVNSLADPETPYDQSLGLQSQIPRSVLVSTKTPGHTVYVRPGPAADAIDSYLIDGILPAQGLLLES